MSEKNDRKITKELESRLDALFKENDQFQSIDFNEDSEDPADYPLKELKGIVLSIDWEITDEIMTKFAEEIGRLNNRYKDDTILLMFLKILHLVGKYIAIKKAGAHPNAIKVFKSAFIQLDIVVSSKGITEAEKKKILLKEIAKFNKLKEQITLAKTAAPREVEGVPSEEVKFVPEEKEIPIEEPRMEIPLEERLAEEVELVPEEEEVTLEELPEKMPLEEEEPEEIEFAPEEVIAPEGPTEEIVLQTEEEKPVSVEKVDLSALPLHEAFAYAMEGMQDVIKAEFKALRAELKLWREGQ